MMTRKTSEGTVSRRKFIAASGAAGIVGIAGCTSETNGGTGGNTDGGNGGAATEETTSSDSSGKLSGNIEISGSSTVYPLATAVSELFRRKHPNVEINVRSTGTGGGFKNFFCPGRTDFNNASRPIEEGELESCTGNGINPVELEVATDALTVIVNPENDWVDCVTVDELQQIWSADGAEKWSDVNPDWPDKQIERYGPARTSGTFDYFNEVIIGEDNNHTQDYQATEDDNIIVTGVSGSKYAVGYLGFAYYTGNKDKVKALKIDNGDGCIAPTIQNAKAGKYAPLSRPLFTYAAKESLAEEHIAEFARFFVKKSTDKQLVAEKIGYVPNSESEAQKMMDRLNKAIKEAQSA
jgi:phosphate transport system substrate-binding protein